MQKFCRGGCPDIAQWLPRISLWRVNSRNLPTSSTFQALCAFSFPIPSPILHNCSLSTTSSHPSLPGHTFSQLLSLPAFDVWCSLRFQMPLRSKEAGVDVCFFSFLNAGDWSLDWLVRSAASTAVLTSRSPASSCTFLYNRLNTRTS